MSPTNGHVTKLFLESEFQQKGNKQMIKREFSANLAVSGQEQIQKIKLFEYFTEKDKNKFGQNKWTKICLDKIVIMRTGTYL